METGMEELYHGLEDGQQPHSLFIACSDSRVVPHMLADARPGEIFVIRTIANIIPPVQQAENFPAAAASLEYAVEALGVQRIVVCGHSNCGGCAALYDEEAVSRLPHTERWLEVDALLKGRVERRAAALGAEQEPPAWAGGFSAMVEKENILLQLDHLRSYFFVRAAEAERRLLLEGWYFDIGERRLYRYREQSGRFEPIPG